MVLFVLVYMLGYACEVHDNPADHFLDVITTCEEESTQCGEFSHRRPVTKCAYTPHLYINLNILHMNHILAVIAMEHDSTSHLCNIVLLLYLSIHCVHGILYMYMYVECTCK